MEENRNYLDMLDQIPQPGLLVRDDRIIRTNQAASAMCLTEDQSFSGLLASGQEDYAIFDAGQLCLTLCIAGRHHNAVVTPMEDKHLILLDQDEDIPEFRSMALVSMQMRGPLMQAISSAQQLAENPEDPAAAKLNRSLMQMLRLVSNMADIDRYLKSSRMEVCDTDSFLLEIFEKAQTLTAGKIRITYDGLKQPVFSLIDPEQLERAVWNLLSNCIKFMPDSGSIAATLTRQGKLLRLTLEDSGSGIAEAVRATLFHRYQRQPGIEDSRNGLGLGLAFVRSVAANHGGTVLVSPTRTGGTRITLTLALCHNEETVLRSPLRRPDYTGGWDHALVELSDCLDAAWYKKL